jgi:hypothetical protein
MSLKQSIYDMTLTPYYKALISKDGEVIRTEIVKKSNTGIRYFHVKRLKAAFMLPNHKKLVESGKGILRQKSGYIIAYDLADITPMRLRSLDSDETLYEPETMVVNPRGFAPSPLSTEELHDFIEAKVVEDILADEKEGIPMWLIYLVSLGIIAVLVLGAFYMLTKGQQTPVYIPVDTVNPIPTPTQGYVIIP